MSEQEPVVGQKPNKTRRKGKLPKNYVGWVNDYEWHGPISQRPDKPRNGDDEWIQLPGKGHEQVWTAKPRILRRVDKEGVVRYKDVLIVSAKAMRALGMDPGDRPYTVFSEGSAPAGRREVGRGSDKMAFKNIRVAKVKWRKDEDPRNLLDRVNEAKSRGNILWRAKAPQWITRYYEYPSDTSPRVIKEAYFSDYKENIGEEESDE